MQKSFDVAGTELAKGSASEATGRILTEEITALNPISNNNY